MPFGNAAAPAAYNPGGSVALADRGRESAAETWTARCARRAGHCNDNARSSPRLKYSRARGSFSRTSRRSALWVSGRNSFSPRRFQSARYRADYSMIQAHGLPTSQGRGRTHQVSAPQRCAPHHPPWRRDAENSLCSSIVPPPRFLCYPRANSIQSADSERRRQVARHFRR